jgi:hypothetical protein
MADAPEAVIKPLPDTFHSPVSQISASLHRPDDQAGVQHSEKYVAARHRSTMFGMRRRSFWILVVIGIFVVAATIGGSIGGSLAVSNKACVTVRKAFQSTSNQGRSSLKPATQAVSSIASTTAPPGPIASNGVLTSNSTGSTAETYVPLAPSAVNLVNITCPHSLRSYNSEPYDCKEGVYIAPGLDAFLMVAYTLQQCVDACSAVNVDGHRRCRAVVMASAMSAEYAEYGANCWLKNISFPTRAASGMTIAVLTSGD